MAEIASFGVDVDKNTKLAQNAQDTANTANGGVNNINDPNKLGPAEKATLKRKYDTDVLLYGMDKQKLTSSQLSTSEIDSAMSTLTAYMTPFFANMTSTDTVDRDTLNTVYKNFDTADKNADSAFTNMVSSAASGAMVAGNQAKIAGSEAVVAGNQASQAASNASVQASVAVSNANVAQSSAVVAIAKAGFASDTALAASQAVNDAKTSAATAFSAANAARDSAASAISSAANALDTVSKLSVGENLYLQSTESTGYGTSAGTVIAASVPANEHISDYIAVDATQPYVLQDWVTVPVGGQAWYAINFYDKNKVSISRDAWGYDVFTASQASYSVTKFNEAGGTAMPANTAYVRVSFRKYTDGKLSFTAGNVVPGYAPNPEDVQVQISDINGQLESKVSQTTYDALAGTVSENSTLSKQNHNALINKADSQTVNLLKQTVDSQATSIDETAKKVELKADESKVDTIAGTVDSQAAILKIMAGDISGLTNSTKTLGGQYTTLSGQFNLSSQTWETNFSKVQNNIGNLSHSFNADTSTAGYTSDSDGSFKTHTPNSEHRTDYIPIDPTKQYYLKVVATVSPSGANWLGMTFYDKDKKFISRIDGYAPAVTENVLQTSLIAYNYTDSAAIKSATIPSNAAYAIMQARLYSDGVASWGENLATVTALTQVKQTAEGAQVLATNNQGDITSLQATAKGLQASVSNAATKDQLNILSDTFSNEISSATSAANSKMIQTINNASIGFANPDGSKFQMNLSADGTALMDFSKIMLNGATNIQDATISTVKIADAAITNAKIGRLAVGTAQIADLAVTSAKVSEIDASLIKSGTVDTNRLNADAIIANVINGKTINGITINTPTLNLGLNGQFIETYNYTQDTSWFLPKKASGSVTFNHGVIEDQGTMQSYVNGTWGAINDSSVFTSGMTNNVWTEYAPGYYKIDMYKQGSTSNVLQRTYADPTGYYYTDAAGDKSYLGNVLQTPQVQTGSLFSTTLNQMPGDLRMRVVANGSDWGLQVGSYAGSEAVLSDFIYNSTSSSSANLHITANGHIVRSTSASKYKYNIKHAIDEDSLADKLLTMHVSTWNDKHAVDSYAQTLTDNNESEDISIEDNYGLIAEDLRDAGLDMFIEYGKNHTIEGIEYDRAWLPLLPKMRQMNDKINEYELRISKLEAKINE